MKRILIRTAEDDDLNRITEIYNQAIDHGEQTADLKNVSIEEMKNWLQSHKNETYPVFVALIDGSVVGYLSFSNYRRGRLAVRFTSEVSIYIDNNHLRKGIARELLEYATSYAIRIGTKSIFAIVLDTNIASISFFMNNGFEKWGHMPRIADFCGKEVGHIYLGKRIN